MNELIEIKTKTGLIHTLSFENNVYVMKFYDVDKFLDSTEFAETDEENALKRFYQYIIDEFRYIG